MTTPYEWAWPGNKVVCVRSYNGSGKWVCPDVPQHSVVGPVAEGVYTIREAGVGLHPGHPDILTIRLVEIVNPVGYYLSGKYEAAFDVSSFRPLVSDDNNIEAAFYLGKDLHSKRPAKVDA